MRIWITGLTLLITNSASGQGNVVGSPGRTLQGSVDSTAEYDSSLSFEVGRAVHHFVIEMGKVDVVADKPRSETYDRDPTAGTFKSEKMQSTAAMVYFFPYSRGRSRMLAGVGIESLSGVLKRKRGGSGDFYLWSYAAEMGMKSQVNSWATAETTFGLSLPAAGKTYTEYDSESSTTDNESVVETRVKSGIRSSLSGRFFFIDGAGAQLGIGTSFYIGRLLFDGREAGKYSGSALSLIVGMSL